MTIWISSPVSARALWVKLQERYGITKEAAQQDADAWLRTMKEEPEPHYAGRH